jgi:hypothetical protein
VCRDQAAAPLDRILEGRLFQQCFCARINQQRKFTGILDPGRPQAPAHQAKMPGSVLDDHYRNRLRGRDIELRWKIRLLCIAEHLPYRRRRRGDYKASAHSVAKLDIDSD